MNKQDKVHFQLLSKQLNLETECADLLAQALTNGGIDKQFEALAFYEHLRNGIRYAGVVRGMKTAKRAPRNPNHPTQGWFIVPPRKPREEE